MSLSRAQAGMVLDPASAWEPVRMNKKENPNTIIPEHYIRRAATGKEMGLLSFGRRPVNIVRSYAENAA